MGESGTVNESTMGESGTVKLSDGGMWWSQEWPDHSSFVRRTGERIKAREREVIQDRCGMW
jgi:hypothetical protein